LLNSSRFGKSLVKNPSFFLSGLSLKMSLYLLFSRYGCLPSLHLVKGRVRRRWSQVSSLVRKNVQKRNNGKVAGKVSSAPHSSGDQLLAFAALILATAPVCINEGLAEAQWRRKSESAGQLPGARDLNWRFIQLRHVFLKTHVVNAPSCSFATHLKRCPTGSRFARRAKAVENLPPQVILLPQARWTRAIRKEGCKK